MSKMKRWLSFLVIILVCGSIGYFSDGFGLINKEERASKKLMEQETKIRDVFQQKRDIKHESYIRSNIKVMDRNGDPLTLSNGEQEPVVDLVVQWMKLKFNLDYEKLTIEDLKQEKKLFISEVQRETTEADYDKAFVDLKETRFRSFLERFQVNSIQFSIEDDIPVYKVLVSADAYQAKNGMVASLHYQIHFIIDQKEKRIKRTEIIESKMN